MAEVEGSANVVTDPLILAQHTGT